MPEEIVIAIPVKPFDASKRRLQAALSAEDRRILSRRLAARTTETIRAAGATPLVLAADSEVAGWAQEMDVAWIADPGSSLDAAAAGAVSWAREHNVSWAICHADLPLLRPGDLKPAIEALREGRGVIAPSSDGGTSLLGSLDPIRFAYGPGSFHLHLAQLAAAHPLVMASLGLALDLDTPTDLDAAARHPRGAWLRSLLPLHSLL